MNRIWAVILMAFPIVVVGLAIIYIEYSPQALPPVVVSNGCSYYQIYHSRRSQHYEYVHCPACTNREHNLIYKENANGK